MTAYTPVERAALPVLALAFTAVHASRPSAAYRALELGAGDGQVGLVVGAFGGISLFLAVPFGRLIDWRGERWMLRTGCLALLLASVLAWRSASVAVLALSQACLGVGQMAIFLGVQTIASRTSTIAQRDRRFALLFVAASVGQLSGPLIAGWLIGTQPRSPGVVTDGPFLVALTLALVALMFTRWVARPRPAPAGIGDGHARPTHYRVRTVLSWSGLPVALLVSLVVLVALDVLIAYLPVIGERRGISAGVVGMVLSARAMASMVSRAAMSRMLRRLGRRRVLSGSLMLAAVGACGLTVATTPTQLAILVVLFGLGIGIGSPLTGSWLAGSAPPGGRASALSLQLVGNRLGQLTVPALVGSAAGVLGLGLVFAATAGGLLLCGELVRRSQHLDPVG